VAAGAAKQRGTIPLGIRVVGPQPVAQRQVILRKEPFAADFVPWLMFNRQGLNILIHSLTDDEVEDHTEHAVCLGTPVGLLTNKLQHGRTIAEIMPD
jgi:aromatic ring-cleaving dioxygenase